jgi:hypothetical protein
MRIKTTKLLFAAAALIATLMTVPAKADSVLVGSGTWDSGTPTTSWSAAGATWQFSFQVADPIPGGNVSAPVTYFQYFLNGTLVSNSLPGGVAFYADPDPSLGGFDLFTDLNNSSPDGVNIVSLYLSIPSLNLPNGTFAAGIGLNDGALPGSGSGSVTIAHTPEPPSIVLLGTALLLGGSLVCIRRTQQTRASTKPLL